MRKKWGIICTILVIGIVSFYNIQKKPKVVSCITTTDTAYITVLLEGKWPTDREIVARKIIEMCEKKEFAEIKFSVDKDTYYVTVYRNRCQLNKGVEWILIKYNFQEKKMRIL